MVETLARDHKYGEHSEQFVRLHLGPTTPADAPIAFILHGGYWKNKYGVDNAGTNALAKYLCQAGWVRRDCATAPLVAIVNARAVRSDDVTGGCRVRVP